jgi:mannosyltransferase OCH1-like enzyme
LKVKQQQQQQQPQISQSPAGMIPRILHHTVKDKVNMLPLWRDCLNTWQEKMAPVDGADKAWKIMVWDDADNDRFIQTEYPQYYQLFLMLPRKINQVDFVRYLYMHKFGGFYADADTKCLKSIEPLRTLPGAQVVLGEYSFYLNKFVECAIMGSVPGHPLWLQMIEAIRLTLEKPTLKQRLYATIPSMAVMTQTGPLRFADVVYRTKKDPNLGPGIVLLPQHVFYPNPKREIPADSYTVHLCNGSWVGSTERSIYEMLKNKAVLTILIVTALIILFCLTITLLTRHAKTSSSPPIATTVFPLTLTSK